MTGADIHDDAESVDAAPLDLTPRDVSPRRKATGSRRGVAIGALVLVVVALGFVVFQGLTSATVYFYNVNEAVAKRSELGTSRFRIQGNVIPGTVRRDGNRMSFELKYDGVKVRVEHRGDIPDLFKPAIPVVLEGAFNGQQYDSDRMFLRHDATYDEKNADRNRDAENDAKQQS